MTELCYGIDVSRHQGDIDWAAVAASGKRFALVRIGWSWYEGGLSADSSFAANVQGALAAGLDVGAYVYAYDLTPEAARKAACAAAALLRGYRLTYPVFYDQEYEPCIKALDKQRRTDNCLAFITQMEALGWASGLYASLDWFKSWVDDAQLGDIDRWVAQYDAAACGYGGEWTLWQYAGGKGRCAGVQTACDLDACRVDYPARIAARGLNDMALPAPEWEPLTDMVATAVSEHCELFGTPDIYDVVRRLSVGEQLRVTARSKSAIGPYVFLQVEGGYLAYISGNVLLEAAASAVTPEETPDAPAADTDDAAAQAGPTVLTVTATALRLRRTPEIANNRCGALYDGERVVCWAVRGDWACVSLGERHGWASLAWLQADGT